MASGPQWAGPSPLLERESQRAVWTPCYKLRQLSDTLKTGVMRMDERDHQFALSYGPEDAFTLHRYHCPPGSPTPVGGVLHSGSRLRRPLDRPARDISWLWLNRPPIRGRRLRRRLCP